MVDMWDKETRNEFFAARQAEPPPGTRQHHCRQTANSPIPLWTRCPDEMRYENLGQHFRKQLQIQPGLGDPNLMAWWMTTCREHQRQGHDKSSIICARYTCGQCSKRNFRKTGRHGTPMVLAKAAAPRNAPRSRSMLCRDRRNEQQLGCAIYTSQSRHGEQKPGRWHGGFWGPFVDKWTKREAHSIKTHTRSTPLKISATNSFTTISPHLPQHRLEGKPGEPRDTRFPDQTPQALANHTNTEGNKPTLSQLLAETLPQTPQPAGSHHSKHPSPQKSLDLCPPWSTSGDWPV